METGGPKSGAEAPRILYGYVRVVRGGDERARSLRQELLEFCRSNEFMLGTVFTDWGVEDSDIARPAFSSLLDVCQLVGSYGVLVPTREHLSATEATLELLTRQIRRTGSKLIAVNTFQPAATSTVEPNVLAQENQT